MNQDLVQKLEGLRSQVMDELLPLVEQAAIEPAQQFDLVLTIARSSGDPERFEQALRIAQRFENLDDKATALFDLLDAIDSVSSEAVGQPQSDEASQGQPEVENQQSEY